MLVAPGNAAGGDLKVVLSAAVATIRTNDEEHPEYGGSDTISGNAKGDIIAGGVQGDTLYGDRAVPTLTTSGNDGNDVILGDNGAFEWLSTGRLGEVQGIDISHENPFLFAKFNGGVADTDVATLDLVTTEQPTNGGRDTIYGDEGDDLAFGGTDLDWIHGDDGDEAAETAKANKDVLFGDHGRLYPHFSVLQDFNSRNFFAIDTGNGQGGEGDLMWGEEGDDVMLGQQGDDRMWGGSQADDMIGGHNVEGGIDELAAAAVIADSNPGPHNTNDVMDGGSGSDAMKGDNVIVWRRADDLLPRFRTLTAPSLYTTSADGVLDAIINNLGAGSAGDPNDAVGRDITVVDHADVVRRRPFRRRPDGGRRRRRLHARRPRQRRHAGRRLDQRRKDPGPNTITITHSDAGLPDTDGTLYFNIPEALTDGDDYIEGSGGNDLIFGGLGQDDLIGGSSSFFGLDTEQERPDGSDIIFGGAGTPARLARNDFVGASDTDTGSAEGVGAVSTNDDPRIALRDRHSRDADFIMGDNANVFRIVGAGDAYLQYGYDQSSIFEDRGDERIVVRAMQQLDYTLGGADFAGGAYVNGVANADNGLADLIHGESGDDYIFGMTGSDVIFGESDDDDIVGGYGNDWISGGTGQDGILGDDGLIFTSRNGTLGEALYGIAGLLASDAAPKYNNGNALDEIISTPGDVQYAVINPLGRAQEDGGPGALQPRSDLDRAGRRVRRRREQHPVRRRHHLRRPGQRLPARRRRRRRDVGRGSARARVRADLRRATGSRTGSSTSATTPSSSRLRSSRATAFRTTRATCSPSTPGPRRAAPQQPLPRRRVLPLRRVRPAAAHRAHRHRRAVEAGRRRVLRVAAQLRPDRGHLARERHGAEGDRAADRVLPGGSRRRQGRDLRRPRQRLAGRRHRSRQPVRRLGQRPAQRRRRPDHDRRRAEEGRSASGRSERPSRHASVLRGPRLRRRGPRRADRQYRRRPPDRLGGRVQQLPRTVRAVRAGDRQPHADAAPARVPVRAFRCRRRGSDALRRRGGRHAARAHGQRSDPDAQRRALRRARPGAAEGLRLAGADRRAGRSAGRQHPGRAARCAALGGLPGRFHGGLLRRYRQVRRAERRAEGGRGFDLGRRRGGVPRGRRAAGLFRSDGLGQHAEAHRRLEGERLRDVRLRGRQPTTSSPASTCRATSW